MVRTWEIVTYHLQSSENREAKMVCDTTDKTSICKETCGGSMEGCFCSLGLPSSGTWRRTRVWSSKCCILLGARELRTHISRCPHLALHLCPLLTPTRTVGRDRRRRGYPHCPPARTTICCYNFSYNPVTISASVSTYFFLWQPTSPNSINKIIKLNNFHQVTGHWAYPC